jgi:hypothetical protein
MPLSYEDRVKLLEKARKAKADKRAGLNQVRDGDAELSPAPVKKSRAKKQPEGRTLELPPEPAPMSDDEPEVEERIVYRPKTQKKKKIIRTIIKDPSDDEDEEEIHETVEQPPKPKKQIPATQPKLCPSKSSFFCY